MTLAHMLSTGSSRASALRHRPATVWIAGSLIAVGALMAFVDGPLAEALSRWPSGFTHAIGAIAAPIKGFYLIGLSLVASLALVVAYAVRREENERLREYAIDTMFVCAATIVALICASILKILIGRSRPELMAIYGPHAFFPFSTANVLTSFPSGETSMVVTFFGACALALRGRWGALSQMFWVPAVFIAASRPIVGAHYLSDVIASVLISVLVVQWLYGVRVRHQDSLSDRMYSLWYKVRTRKNPN